MHRQRAEIERHHNELAAPLNSLDGSSRNLESQGAAVPGRHETRSETGRQDAPAGRCGARERTTVSTSGSSGNLDQDLAVFNFHGKLGELYFFIEIVAARAAV